jgi:3' terminal RNA ribose 2'-O-methyltransferase Hen1
MLLTITSTRPPATDLGYLLHKHPERVQSFDLPFGRAHVFYPEASEERCSAALLLDLDPIGLVRGPGRRSAPERTLAQYVNDRPYVASSFLSVALGRVFGTALSGKCSGKPELEGQSMALTATIAALPARGGEPFIRKLFEPLGYVVEATRHPLDSSVPDWGESRYYSVTLTRECTLAGLLTHLYVLIPVLDDEKHYWVGRDEIDKLLKHGADWLESHPEREQITHRYLRRQWRLTRDALARLQEDEGDPDADQAEAAAEEAAVEERLGLNEQRQGVALAVLREARARTVVDLGCGEGKFLQVLLKEKQFDRIAGIDVSPSVLERAASRLKLDRMAPARRERISLLQGALTYRDTRLADYDAATILEVIEHLDLERLGAFERVVFEFAKPRTVVVSTPNVEFNGRFENLPAGTHRHRDHRFEWTRAEFVEWATGVAERNGYGVRYLPAGEVDPDLGPPTQFAVFELNAGGVA